MPQNTGAPRYVADLLDMLTCGDWFVRLAGMIRPGQMGMGPPQY